MNNDVIIVASNTTNITESYTATMEEGEDLISSLHGRQPPPAPRDKQRERRRQRKKLQQQQQ
jgi:hypothetical protein